ncbi:MAG: AI-2E family transporter [Melioribacteraceae bacterium]|jgi:predicted PurR-regulated permease PerM|nr:AI-2E family transporter [Melioribacteraceae bacterium]
MRNNERLNRSRIFYFSLFVFFLIVFGYLLVALQDLVLPVLMGTLAAYISLPGINYLRRKGIPKAFAIIILLGAFSFLVFVLGQRIVSALPSDKEELELRIQLQYKLNENFLAFLGKENLSSKGNIIDDLVGDELNQIFKSVNSFLAFDKNEVTEFQNYIDNSLISERVLFFYSNNLKHPILPAPEIEEKKTTDSGMLPLVTSVKSTSKIAIFLNAISSWVILPFVFIFILIDEGEIKNFFLGIVPNRYFEMTFAAFSNVDKAIGNYLRGTLLQSSLVGLTIFLGLLFIGFKIQAAILIGIIAGISNAIPFLGPIIGLGTGVLYAMIVEGIDPILPFMPDNPLVGVLIVVLTAQFLDNAVFQPLVLGKAVNLHPLVVVIGVTGGSIIAGFWGMLLAIPTIVIFKVVISTLYRQAKEYYIIY